MPNNKLPAYFEKYFEGKFGDIDESIKELKLHVNDEIQLLRKEMSNFRKQMLGMWVLIIILLILHIESFGSGFITSFKIFLGL